jgi:4-amino-4-deoxy-L-arabinose transferase-like glycosyltransferase
VLAARWSAVAVIVLTLVAIVLRVPDLASRSLWLDEAWRANLAMAPSWHAFWSGVLGAGSGEVDAPLPPLFALALRAATTVLGHSEAALRAVPFAASVAAVPLAYLVGRACGGRAAGIAAAFCFALYPNAVLYGRELKQYSVDVFVVLGLLLLASRVARRPDDLRAWAAFALAAALVPGCSYPAALLLPGIALGLLIACRDRRTWSAWLTAHACAGIAALTWYVLAIGPQRARPLTAAYWAEAFPTLTATSLAVVARTLASMVEFATSDPAVVFIALVLVGYACVPRWFAVTALATLVCLVVAGLLHAYPLTAGRTSLFLLPFVYVPLGVAVAWIGGRLLTLAGGSRVVATFMAVAALALLAWPARAVRYGDAALVREETAPLVQWLAAERRPEDRVYVYYAAGPAFAFYHPARDDRVTVGGSHRGENGAYEAELRPLVTSGERMWLLFSHIFTPRGGANERDLILNEMRLYGREVARRDTAGASMHLFEVTRNPGSVRHLKITPEDMANPERMRELLGR